MLKKSVIILIGFYLPLSCFSQENEPDNINPWNFYPKRDVGLQIEGDFTNSGLQEKIFLYKDTSPIDDGGVYET
jgi:hypothetical protein